MDNFVTIFSQVVFQHARYIVPKYVYSALMLNAVSWLYDSTNRSLVRKSKVQRRPVFNYWYGTKNAIEHSLNLLNNTLVFSWKRKILIRSYPPLAVVYLKAHLTKKMFNCKIENDSLPVRLFFTYLFKARVIQSTVQARNG